LPGRVPDLKFDIFAIDVRKERSEFNANRQFVRGLKDVLCRL
jgi:hypothetical protein